MGLAGELAALFERDLTRLVQQLEACQDAETLWRNAPGITNSAGHLALHLEGNLREYVGRVLGGVSYRRAREQEFTGTRVPASELAARLEEVRRIAGNVIGELSDEQLEGSLS